VCSSDPLQAAAVVGKDVPYALLQAIADEPEGPLRQRLTGLQAAEFLYETRLFPELEYTFKHALTHEVAYGSLLGERRRALHAQVVEAIERVYADRLAEHVERLAHHAFRGEVWSQAITYSRQAGLKAQARSANRESVPYFEQALVALGRLPPSHETTALAIDLRHDLHNSMVPLIRFEQVFENLTIAHALAESLDDERRLVWILAAFAQAFWARGEHDQVVAYGRRAVASATTLGDLGQVLAARRFLGNAYHSLGDYALAIEAYTANVQAVERDLRYARFDGYTAPIPVSLGWLAVCHAERGEFDRASAAAEEAVRIADAVQHPHTVLQAYHRVGAAHVLLGTLDRAIAVLERGLRVCQEAEIPRQYSLLIATLGYAYALDGRIAEGLPLAERGMAQSPSSTRATYLAEVYLLAERADEALQTAERALALSRQHKERGEEARALRLLGAVAAHAEPPNVEPAEDYYCQALALADELGMRPLVAHCHLGLGTLYRKIDRDDEARAELTTAAEMYRAMEMTFWLARADAALAAVGD